jgi:D-methionine transport system ATP-binding protein
MGSEPFIAVRKLKKTFHTHEGALEVLKGIDLEIDRGDIYGIIGFSGAGKSTLLRCLNRLESPDSGTVTIGDVEITALDKTSLNGHRQKVGMIFQQFNLFDSRTVYRNVSFPLEVAGIPKARIRTRVEEILELVELTDKINCHPGQLSGGQKQRVGIARALANQPDVLLSDEATSALDPQTTFSILELLKDINRKLGLTIVLVTHELEVIKYACTKMAVIQDGVIIEKGDVRSVFLNPKSETSKQFIKINDEFLKDFVVEEGGGI